MSELRVYYSAAYAPEDSPLLARLGHTAAQLRRHRLAELYAPQPVDPALLRGLHSDRYIDAFLQGAEPLASSQGIRWTPRVRDATLAMLGGQLEAVEHAFEHGIAMNLARGFHHAVRDRGAGYCPIDGLALVAHHWPQRRVMVIDCDEHGGNGTEEFAAELPNLYNVSIFGTRFGCRGGVRSWPFEVNLRERGYSQYKAALIAARQLAIEHRPDLILYQAGADCHLCDPKSRAGLSSGEMFRRDQYVFRMARELRIPIMFVVAGGYQEASRVALLNLNTVRAAVACYGEMPLAVGA